MRHDAFRIQCNGTERPRYDSTQLKASDFKNSPALYTRNELFYLLTYPELNECKFDLFDHREPVSPPTQFYLGSNRESYLALTSIMTFRKDQENTIIASTESGILYCNTYKWYKAISFLGL